MLIEIVDVEYVPSCRICTTTASVEFSSKMTLVRATKIPARKVASHTRVRLAYPGPPHIPGSMPDVLTDRKRMHGHHHPTFRARREFDDAAHSTLSLSST